MTGEERMEYVANKVMDREEDAIAMLVAKITDGLFTDEELIKEIDEYKEKYNLTDEDVVEILDTAEDLINADNQADADSTRGITLAARAAEKDHESREGEETPAERFENIGATKKALDEVDSIDDSVFEDYTKENATNRLANMLSGYRW